MTAAPATAPAPVLVNNRYELRERIGRGGMGEVFRAHDRLSGQTVALKRVDVSPERFTFGTTPNVDSATEIRLSLAREFKTLATLRHPHIISVIDYGFEQGQPFFTMELLEDAKTLIAAGKDVSLALRLLMVAQILEALTYLHRRGTLHRDLKPGNVLVIPQSSTLPLIKVVDFGLAISRGEAGSAAGTLAYIAPEALLGEPITEASDLYAVGVMMYELIAGQLPYKTTSRLIEDILHTPPDLSRLHVEPAVAALVGRLMAKNPRERFANAADVLTTLATTSGITLPPNAAIRDSFLQAAQFVGRDREFATLEHALLETTDMHPPYGGAWLIGGESGVGKSRLVDELRTRALVEGALVIRAQATEAASTPFALWQPVLRTLALISNLSDAQASVLKKLIPEMDDLIGRTTPTAPDLEPQVLASQLLDAVEAMVRQQTRPLLLLLEDLHWASEENLTMLARLLKLGDALPIMWVGTYRDDEAPDLPPRLSEMKLLRLGRLSHEGIAALSASMLGDSGSHPKLVNLIEQETEGNAFFIVEVVRALAEAAGELAQIGAVPLPKQVLAGGIQRVLTRRLNRVPPTARPLLEFAAVHGREIDLPLLSQFSRRAALDDWLTTCSDAAILEVYQDRWRFAHDKLRETLLNGLTAEQRVGLHKQVAEALETTYAANLDRQAAALAQHWSAAGDLAKEAHYALLAGDAAFDLNLLAQATAYYDRSLQLVEQLSPPERLRLFTRRGRALEIQSRVDDAYANYQQMEALGEATTDTALRLGALSGRALLHALFSHLHDEAKAIAFAQEGLTLARAVGDRTTEARLLWVLLLTYGLTGKYRDGLAYGEQAAELGRELNLRETLAYILNDLSRCYIGTGQITRALESLREAKALWEALNNRPMLVDALSGMALTQHLLSRLDDALEAAEQAYTISQPDNLWGQIYAQVTIGYVHAERAQAPESLANMQAMLENSQRASLIAGSVFGHFGLALVYTAFGSLHTAAEHSRQARALIVEYHLSDRFLHFANSGAAYSLALAGEWDDARTLLAGLRYDPEDFNTPTAILACLAEGEIALHDQNVAEALKRIDHLIAHMRAGGHRLLLPDMLLLAARLRLAAGMIGGARRDAAAAHALAHEVGIARLFAFTLHSQAQVELAAGNEDYGLELRSQAQEALTVLVKGLPEELRAGYLSQPRVRALLMLGDTPQRPSAGE